MWHTIDDMGWWMLVIGIFWMLFWVSVAAFIVAAIARGGGRDGRSDQESAIEIARRRLAGGEISPEQFQEIRRHLDVEMRPPQPT